MWPWEHLAFGYLLYSLAIRATTGDPPRGASVIVLAVATQVPDLVDKPLAWSLDVFAVGYAVGHSVFVVGPLLVVAAILAWRRGARASRFVGASAVGHLSHLIGDLVYPLVLGDGLLVERLLWPVATFEPAVDRGGLLARVAVFFHRYLEQLLALEFGPAFLVQVGLVLGVLALWLVDGRPGLGVLRPPIRN
jgi:hypothetical protein